MSDGGKGSAPRKQRDDEAFRQAWERIFGNKRKQAEEQKQKEDRQNGK